MRQLTLYIFGLLLLIIGCSQPDHIKQDSEVNKFAFIIPTVLDTFNGDGVERENIWQESGRYNPIYLGKRKDSILLWNGHVRWVDSLKAKYFVYENKRNRFPYPDSSGIEIIIDTTQSIFEYAIYFSTPQDTELKTKYYKAHPVFVINTVKDTISIGYGDHLPLILEAQDKNGKWKAIEKEYIYICGNGLNTIILPPDNIVVTAVPIFKGQFKTKLRLRYGNILSDTFTGSIKLSQFESAFDENGDRKSSPTVDK